MIITTYLSAADNKSFLLMTSNKFKSPKIIEDNVTAPHISNYKILVVEDEPISQRVAQLALENLGCKVDIAGTGSKALELFSSHSYSVILMDMGLPDMTGIDVTKQIRELEKIKGFRTPIIALTAHIAALAKEECLKAGMDEFSTKPLDIDLLNGLLKNWFGIKV